MLQFKKNYIYILFFTIILAVTFIFIPIKKTVTLLEVVDGDTILVKYSKNETPIKIRFFGIDTPEMKQQFGIEAKELTQKLIKDKIVSVQKMDIDIYGRIVGLIYLGEEDVTLNERLIEKGYAWVYKKYCKRWFCSKWINYENESKRSKIGLFSDPNSIPPWVFRNESVH